ncbi:MAG: hypothetical protein A4E19_02160 [Nitrospira sp. SG-bin1]|nr:MAG: hypothetical protein A4E19_02160 [Nitrospira sp. SG-bin1]
MSLRNLLRLVLAVGLWGIGGQAWAYDASPNISSGYDACTDVIFSAFTPAPFSQDKNNVEVAPKSEFSFLASKTANPQRITVKIKEEKVPVTVTTINNGFLVKGKLPVGISGSFIRVDIYAKGPNDCDKADGWLLKVGK